ncbi:MAG: DMT family protein [Sandaracinaceae bacterium]|nr:DMT family protein [Sandaracinaceae bacterium]
MSDAYKTAGLLFASNLFMTTAWYGHLKIKQLPMWQAILGSWLIALLEYCLMVPANRIGHRTLSAYQLKIMQEAITLVVFVGFAVLVLREPVQSKYLLSFGLIFAAVVVAFR